MPRTGVEAQRRAALIDATIAEIGAVGSLEVKVADIARRAGVSSALAHHYFGHKDALFLAAMRHILRTYGESVRTALTGATTPRARLEAIVRANFAPGQFAPAVIAAWLNFYVLAQEAPEARRLLRVYQRRLHSNLLANLRPLLGPEAERAALGLAAMIDGLYLRHALRDTPPDTQAATALTLSYLAALLQGALPEASAPRQTHSSDLSPDRVRA